MNENRAVGRWEPAGNAVRWTGAAPPSSAARAQRVPPRERYGAYCDGIRAVVDQLWQAGLTIITNDGYSASLSGNGVILDFRLQDPSKVAHIAGDSSPAGHARHFLSDAITGDWCLQVCVVLRGTAAKPQYLQLDENHPDPAEHVARLLLNCIGSMREIQSLPALARLLENHGGDTVIDRTRK